jgi:adenylate kinase family enzyme
MMQKIHIFGASGSGTTSLAKAVAEASGCQHYDTDNYFWIPTIPPFQSIRERPERQELLRQDLQRNESWVISGSLCGWGDFAIPMFDLVVFLWLPTDLRMQRLKRRETERFGSEIENPNDPRYQGHMAFLEWAAAYDTGGLDMRSKSNHEEWISALPCQVIRIEHDRTILENLKTIMTIIWPDQLTTLTNALQPQSPFDLTP